MSKKMKIALIAGIVLFAIILLFTGNKPPKKANKNSTSKSVNYVYSNWDKKYELASKEPYGLYHFNAALKFKIDGKQEIYTLDHIQSLQAIDSQKHPTFVFIGETFALYDIEVDSLLKAVGKGSQLFISANEIDTRIMHPLFDNLKFGFYYDTILQLGIQNKKIDFVAYHEGYTVAKSWWGYKEMQTADSLNVKILAGTGTISTAIQIPYGKGNIFISTIPDLYTNHQLLSKNGLEHAKLWFDNIPKNESIYWLELARFESYFHDEYESDEFQDSSYLQYIFEDKTRVISLFLLFVAAILFVIFRTRRLQPVVPILPKKRNMTLIFADTITSIFYNQRNPNVVLRIQRNNFYSIVDKHFHVDLTRNLDDKKISILAEKTGISTQFIQSILTHLETKGNHQISEEQLAQLRAKILQFYKEAGIVSQRTTERLNTKEHQAYKNEWISTLLLLMGVFTIFYGFYLLAAAYAIGILFWPLGIIPLTIGILRFSRPALTWTTNTITIYPLIGKPSIVDLQHIKAIEQDEQKLSLFNGEKWINIPYYKLNKSDAKQLKRFAINHNKLK